jgi:translocation and assembly module TamB
MQSLRKPILLLTAVMVSVACLVFFGALLWIKSGRSLTWAQSRINTTIPGTISIQRHRLSLLESRLDLYDVVLRDIHGSPVAGFTHLSVAVNGWAALHGEVHLKDIRLREPWADLAVDAATGLNLLSALAAPDREETVRQPAASGAGLPVNIVCRSFQLTDGRLSFAPATPGTRLEADGITLSADADLAARKGTLDLQATRVRLRSPDIHPMPARIALKARLDGDTLRLPALDILSGRTTVRLKGSATALWSLPRVDGELSVDSRLADMKAIFDLAGDYAGSASAALSLKGALNNPAADLSLAVDNARIAGYPLDRGRLSVNLKDRLATVDDGTLGIADGKIAIKGAIDLREAFPAGFFAPPDTMDNVAYAFELLPNLPHLHAWLKPWIDIDGQVKGRVDLTGKGLDPSAISTRLAFDGSGRHLLVAGMDHPVDADLHLAVRLERGNGVIDRLSAVVDTLNLSGNGRFQLDDRTIGGSLALHAPDLSRALAVVGVPSVSGACDASLIVDGSLDRPQFSLDLAADDIGMADYTLGDLTLKADMNEDGRLGIARLVLQNRASHIEGTGRVGLTAKGGIDPDFSNTVALDLESLSVADFMASPPLEGTIDGKLRIEGPLTSLHGTLTLQGTSMKSAVAAIGDIDTRLRWDNGTLHLDRLDLRHQTSTMTARGRVELLAPGSLRPVEDPVFELTAASDRIDPGDFTDAAKGAFTFKTSLTGSLENPSGTLTLTGSRVEAAGQPLERISLDARLRDRRIELDHLLADIVPGERIEAKGWFGLDNRLDLNVKSDGIAVGNIGPLRDMIPGNGILRFEAGASGRVDNPEVRGQLTVSEMSINNEPIEDMNLAFGLHDMLARASGNLNFGMDATCDLKGGDFDLHLLFDNTETAAYFRAAGLRDIHGTLSGRIDAAGNFRDVGNASAQVDLDALRLLSKKTPLLEADRISMRLNDREMSIPEFEMAVLSSGRLRLEGNAHLDGRLDMAIDGRIPLEAAGAFVPELAAAQGNVVVDGKVTGSMRTPLVDARIDLETIAMPIPGLVQKLHDLNGRLHLTTDTLRIEELRGFLDTGSFQANGTIEHENFTPRQVDLTLSARSLPLDIPDTLTVLLNGDITVTGRDRIADARGAIVLLEGVYYKDMKITLLQLASTATTRQRTVKIETEPLAIPFYDTVNLDISLSHRQPFSVDNNLAQLEISPDLRIGGTLANPILSGRAQIREGSVIFQKKTFAVRKGVIDFINPYRTEAQVDIQSRTQIRSWQIDLDLKGTPDNLDVSLTSVPAETEADIISLILFGKTTQEITAGEGGSQRTTGQIMAEMIADTFGDDIKERTGLDILDVESEDEEDAGGVKVTVGKRLSDRMTVKYAIETKDGATVQRAITEYKLLENILVSGFQDTQGVYGSELAFRIEFR